MRVTSNRLLGEMFLLLENDSQDAFCSIVSMDLAAYLFCGYNRPTRQGLIQTIGR